MAARNHPSGAADFEQVSGKGANNSRLLLLNNSSAFRVLTDLMPQMVWSALPDGMHDYFNARWYEFTETEPGSADGEGWNGIFHPEDQERASDIWKRSLASGEPYEIEYRLRHHSGEYRWVLGRALPVIEDGKVTRWIGTCTDIHETKLMAQQNALLSHELSHRIKNLFAVISGLIGMAGRRNPQFENEALSLREQLSALGRAHNLVRPDLGDMTEENSVRSLQRMINVIMSGYPAFQEGRINIHGEDELVDDRCATPLALSFHELATNAAKYGSLSRTTGRVDIAIERSGDRLILKWSETGSPERTGEPGAAGFGTKLLDQAIKFQLGGSVERNWTKDGLNVMLQVETRRLTRNSRA